MNSTPRLGFGYLSVGQAQKEVTVNETFQLLDGLVCAVVEEPQLDAPPSSPAVGACYIVGNSPTGDWAGRTQCFAQFTSGGWRFVAPQEGLTAYIRSTATWGAYRAGAWENGQVRGSSLVLAGQQVVGSRVGAIASPVGGATVDNEARSAIGEILGAMRQHGLIET
jgi:hypothetical protein